MKLAALLYGIFTLSVVPQSFADQPAHDLGDSYYYGDVHYCFKYGTSPTSVSDAQSTFSNGLSTASHCKSFMHANAFSYYGYYDDADTFYIVHLEESGSSVWLSYVDEYSNTGTISLSGFNSMTKSSNGSSMDLFTDSYGIAGLGYHEYLSGNQWTMGFSAYSHYTKCTGSISKSNCVKEYY